MENNFDENMNAAQAQSIENGAGAEPSDMSDPAAAAANNIPEQPDSFSSQVRELQDTVTDSSIAEGSGDTQSVQPSENQFSGQYVQQAQQMQPPPTGQYGQFQPQDTQQPQQPQYQQGIGGAPQGYGVNYQPQFGQPVQPAQFGQGGYPQPGQNVQNVQPKKKRFSGGCLWSLIGAVIVMFGAVVIFAVKIASSAETEKGVPDSGNVGRYDNLAETQKAEHVVINIPTADKPKLDDADYADRDTGLLTSVGVAKAILPSQVKIKVFDDIPYAPISSGSGSTVQVLPSA